MALTPNKVQATTQHALLDSYRDPGVWRPKRFDDFIGQTESIRQIQIAIEAAKLRKEPVNHILLHGPQGLGKTSLARIIASEMGVELTITSGPAIQHKGDLAGILTKLNHRSVLFIDEVHGLLPAFEEILYPALEDFQIDIPLGTGPKARTIRLALNAFTLVAATTRAGRLTAPLRGRFPLAVKLNFYEVNALADIVLQSAEAYGFEIPRELAVAIAERARGTPRIANNLLARTRNYIDVENEGQADLEVGLDALDLAGVDHQGLNAEDHKLMITLMQQHGGGPVGVETLAASIGEDRKTIEEVVEPYLLQAGFLERTPKGRVATVKSWEHFSNFASLPEFDDRTLFSTKPTEG